MAAEKHPALAALRPPAAGGAAEPGPASAREFGWLLEQYRRGGFGCWWVTRLWRARPAGCWRSAAGSYLAAWPWAGDRGPRLVEYRGMTVEEMDLEAVLARRPLVALIGGSRQKTLAGEA